MQTFVSQGVQAIFAKYGQTLTDAEALAIANDLQEINDCVNTLKAADQKLAAVTAGIDAEQGGTKIISLAAAANGDSSISVQPGQEADPNAGNGAAGANGGGTSGAESN